MDVKVIIFGILLSISKCVFSAVQPVQPVLHQVNRGRLAVDNRQSQPQFKFPDNINNQHINKQNHLPINPSLNVAQNYRQFPARERIQLNPNSNVEQKKLRPNNFLTNGITVTNSHFEQKPQLPFAKQGLANTQLLAMKNQNLGSNIRNPFELKMPNGRLVSTKEALKVHQAVPGIKNIALSNVHEKGSVNQEYRTNLVPAHNANLGNINKNINQKIILPTQQPFANKRYTLIRKTGAVEHYDNLEDILQKYPQVKLPPNLRRVDQITGINKDLKSSDIPRPSQFTIPYTNLNAPLNQYHSNIATPNGLHHPTSFHQQSLQNNAKISDILHDDKYRNTKNPIANTPVIESTIHPKENQGDKIMNLSFQALNAMKNISHIKEAQNQSKQRSEVIADLSKTLRDKPVTNLPIAKLSTQEKKAILTVPTIVNKFVRPLNYTVNPKTNIDMKVNITTEEPKSHPHKNSLNLNVLSNKKIDKNTTTINDNPEQLEKQSTPTIVSNVTNLKTSTYSPELKEIHKIISDQGDSNEDTSLPNKPVLWFTTNDSNFWDKLIEDSANNFVYIINVQSHPKIEKDTKTIVHANGTIVEEITESIWEDYDDVPKIRKTVKITPAADIPKKK